MRNLIREAGWRARVQTSASTRGGDGGREGITASSAWCPLPACPAQTRCGISYERASGCTSMAGGRAAAGSTGCKDAVLVRWFAYYLHLSLACRSPSWPTGPCSPSIPPLYLLACLLAGLLAYWLTDSAATSASRAKALCGPYAVGSRWRPFRQPASQHHIELCKSRPGRKTHVERRWAPCNRMRLHLHPVIICFPSQLACARKGSWVHESFTALSVEQKRIRRIAILRPTSSSAAWRTRANGVCQPNHRRSSCLSAPYRNEAPLQHSPPVAMSCLAVSVAAATG